MNLREADDIITGVWAIFLRKKNAIGYFRVNTSTFIWSFATIIIVVIFQTYIASIDVRTTSTESGELAQINSLFQTVIIMVNWFLWPVISFLICKLMGILPHYTRYIIINNFSSIVTLTIIVIPLVLYQFGMSASTVESMSFFSSFILLFYRWRVIKTALATTGVNASILLFVDFSVTIIVSYAIIKLFHA